MLLCQRSCPQYLTQLYKTIYHEVRPAFPVPKVSTPPKSAVTQGPFCGLSTAVGKWPGPMAGSTAAPSQPKVSRLDRLEHDQIGPEIRAEPDRRGEVWCVAPLHWWSPVGRLQVDPPSKSRDSDALGGGDVCHEN